MAMPDGAGSSLGRIGAPPATRLSFGGLLSISIFWFALNFHWTTLLIVVVPSQVQALLYTALGHSATLVAASKGTALAAVEAPGALIALVSNPFFGLLSDRTSTRWGQRKPYILIGTLVNLIGLLGMAIAPNILSLAVALMLVQFANNAAAAPFHALLPDLVPQEQRGTASGLMGLGQMLGSVGGALAAGAVVNVEPLLSGAITPAAYQRQLFIIYGVTMLLLTVFMVLTVITVRERPHEGDRVAIKPAALRLGLSRRDVLLSLVAIIIAGLVIGVLIATIGHGQISETTINDSLLAVLIVATFGVARVFDFNPRRDPDFAWVLITRLVMMLGIITVQTFLQFYLRDVDHVADAERATGLFITIVTLAATLSTALAGWGSDRFGRKRMVYLSGGFMAAVGLVFILTHTLTAALVAGAIFGLGYGAYLSVDWALVADVLPSMENFARDMGIWNVAVTVPQIIAPVIGGPLLDYFHTRAPSLGYTLLFATAILYCVVGTVAVRFIRSVRT
jgi:MFS family permease